MGLFTMKSDYISAARSPAWINFCPGGGGMSGLRITYLMVVVDGDSIPDSLFNG